MSNEALHRLSTQESREVWDRFDAAFGFRPDMHRFPAITEPDDSITWSLDELNDDPGYHKLDRLVALIQDTLTACTPPDGTLLILEWQHTSYRMRPSLPATDMFLPDALMENLRPGWPRSPYPDGDYPILISEDFQYGAFGHPWEHSLCLFGTNLLDAAAHEVNNILQRVLRHGTGQIS